MVTGEQTLGHDIGKVLLRGAIAVVGLLIIRFVVARLPMVTQAEPIMIMRDTYDYAAIAPLAVAKAGIDILICVVIAFTALALGGVLRSRPTQASGMGSLLLSIALLVDVALLYGSLMDIVPAFLGHIYGWIFLGLGIAALAAVILTAYANLDVITELVFQGGHHAVKASAPLLRPAPPPAAASPVPAPAATQSSAPNLTPAPASATTVAAPQPTGRTHCAACSAALKSGARFCASCGQQVNNTINAASTACPSCGASNPPGSRFCGSCAQAVPST